MNSEPRYAVLVQKLVGRSGVTHITEGKGFGSSGQLKVNGRIFAMLVRGGLVLKLPRARVDELVATGEGTRFDAGKGTPMREWFVLAPSSTKRWLPLAKEALDSCRRQDDGVSSSRIRARSPRGMEQPRP